MIHRFDATVGPDGNITERYPWQLFNEGMDEVHIYGPVKIEGVRGSVKAWARKTDSRARVLRDPAGYVRVILIEAGDTSWRPKAAGRPEKYTLGDLAVGATRLYPWLLNGKGERTDQRAHHIGIKRAAQRANIDVAIEPVPTGLLVRRVK